MSIIFMNLPGTQFTIELMCYHYPEGPKEPVIFSANDVSGARHVALKVTNIEEAFEYIKSQPDCTLINTGGQYRVFTISETEPDKAAKQQAADILGSIQYFYFIDKYGLQWEFEQGHSDIGD